MLLQLLSLVVVDTESVIFVERLFEIPASFLYPLLNHHVAY